MQISQFSSLNRGKCAIIQDGEIKFFKWDYKFNKS